MACASDSCVVSVCFWAIIKLKGQTTASHLNFNLHNKHLFFFLPGLRTEQDKVVKGTWWTKEISHTIRMHTQKSPNRSEGEKEIKD